MIAQEWAVVALALAAYVVGSIPCGLVVSRALGAADPRTTGSGNIGFTNVLRVSGKAAGVLTLAGDLGKGWLVGWTAQMLVTGETGVLVIAFAAVIGHSFSLFLGLQGGKSVATGVGTLLGVAPGVGLGVIVAWCLALAVCRYSSGAALAAFGALPLLAMASGKGTVFVVFAVLLAGLIGLRHKDNIGRLWRGTEPRIGAS